MFLRKLIALLAVFVLTYTAIRVAFYVAWKSEQAACDALRQARGEFIEPEVFPVLGVAFTAVWWPIYAWANLYHDNVLFATPCTKQPATSLP
jgi:hypothetical protein